MTGAHGPSGTAAGPARAALALSCVLSLLIAAFLRNGVWLDDVALLEDVIGKTSGTAWVYNNLGMAYHARDRFADALRAYSLALDRDPNFGKTYANLGLLYYTRAVYRGEPGLIDKAIENLQYSLAVMPDDPVTHRFLGDAFQFKGWEYRAREHYARARELEGTGDRGPDRP